MEDGGYNEYQYDYNGKNLAQLIDECVSLCADIDASYRALMGHVRDGGLTRTEIGAADV